jgi:hypothetical protein
MLSEAMKILVMALIVLSAGLICIVPIAPQPTEWTIYLRTAGPLRYGMSLDEVRQILGDKEARLGGENYGCAYLESKILPEKLDLMFQDKRLVRVDVMSRSVAHTASGARVGDSEDRIKSLYSGRIRVEPHHYDPDGRYLIYQGTDPADRDYELLFETDGERVGEFRSGLARAVTLVEGCS